MQATAIFFAVYLVSSGAAFAAPSSAKGARSAYEAHDYAKALKLTNPAAQKGNAEAQLNLGVMYNNGLGVKKDPNQAIAWWSKAAEKGDDAAIEWWSKASANGHMEARKNLQVLQDSR